MSRFLEKLANRIIAEHNGNLEDIAIVLPTRRAGLFLKQHLAKQLNQTFFSPQIIGFDDFIEKLTQTKIQESAYLIFDLFNIHRQIEKENSRLFSEFASFGEILISDFNDIDLELADAKQIFSFLSEEKTLALWNLDGEELTEFQTNYLHFYQSLHEYYELLNKQLAEKGKAYKGALCRYAAEHIEELSDNFKAKKIWYAGFNALSKSEYKILQFLERSEKAEIIWDADSYYMNNEAQEAGLFLRNYKHHFKNLTDFTDDFKSPKDIEILAASENILQTKYIGEKISEILTTEENLENTAIVLADEELLIPVLNSLPNELKTVNITMGYSFKLTPIHDLVLKIIQLHANCEKFAKKGVYYKDFLAVLTHPFLQKHIQNQSSKSDILAELAKENKVYVTEKEIGKIMNAQGINYLAFSFLFTKPQNAKQTVQKLEDLTEMLLKSDNMTLPEKEFIYTFRKLITHLFEIEGQYKPFDSQQVLLNIYSSLAKQVKIPFYGEPLKGLQIMGLLETRTLDFDRVLVLSVNEGVLPRGRGQHSIIPLRVRLLFGMLTYKEHDAIFAYHFYRLLQKPSKIHLLYNADEEGFNKREQSRFIKQILYELFNYSPSIHISEKIVLAKAQFNKNENVISISKDEHTLAQIASRAERGFSPSALESYLGCSLKFYFAHILRVAENNLLMESIDDATFGIVIHSILERIFNPSNFENGVVDSNTLKSYEAQILSLLEETFESELKNNDFATGRNKLVFETALQMLKTFLKNQQTLASEKELKILETEKALKQTIETPNGNITLYGIADRIEQLDGKLRIADYKTALVKSQNLRLKSEHLQNLDFKQIPEKAFQLLCYSWLYWKQESWVKEAHAGIYSLRGKLSNLELLTIDNNQTLQTEHFSAIEKFLQAVVSQIFDTEIPFAQTQERNTCSYCQFASICGR